MSINPKEQRVDILIADTEYATMLHIALNGVPYLYSLYSKAQHDAWLSLCIDCGLEDVRYQGNLTYVDCNDYIDILEGAGVEVMPHYTLDSYLDSIGVNRCKSKV